MWSRKSPPAVAAEGAGGRVEFVSVAGMGYGDGFFEWRWRKSEIRNPKSETNPKFEG
jgi:hypothetical protein